MDARLADLLSHGIYIGTSSWKYPGWKGRVYRKDYPSERAFAENSLEEYAEHYPAVGVDHTYYAWPNPTTFRKYVEQTPAHFRFGLKVTDAITVFRYPKIKRFGARAGQVNSEFLSAAVFKDQFIRPLEPFVERLAPLILEFSEFRPGTFASGKEFVERLDRFLAEVAPIGLPMAVELRNRQWLKPLYFETLAKHGVSHVFNSWTRMPTLHEQLELVQSYDLKTVVSRILLQPGTKYENAVEAFAPYDQVREPAPALRRGGADLIRFARTRGKPAYIFVNNRAEGCAPLTIEGILNLSAANQE